MDTGDPDLVDGFKHPEPSRRRRSAWQYIVVGVLLAVFLLGAAAPLLAMLARSGAKARAERERLALMNLDYPAASRLEAGDGLPLIYERHPSVSGYTIVRTDYQPLETRAKIAGKPDHQGTFFIEVREGYFGDARTEPSESVSIEVTGDKANPVPQDQYRVMPLVLRIGGRDHAIYSTDWQSEQLGKFRDERFASTMHFSIPTPLYIQWLKEPTLTGSLGPYAFIAPDKTRRSLVELGAALRPRAR